MKKGFPFQSRLFQKHGTKYHRMPLKIFYLSTDIFQFTNSPKTWVGYRIFAVNGSEIAVDRNKNSEIIWIPAHCFMVW